MTLIELLLVLALLVILGSIVVPIFTGSFSSMRLRRAGDQVLMRWSQARARAIETGDIFQFRFAPESGSYQVGRWAPVEVDSEGRPAAPGGAAGLRTENAAPDGTQSASAENAVGDVNAALPDPIRFEGGQSAGEAAADGKPEVQSMLSRGDSLSTPILFFPDGTTTQASVALMNDRQAYLRLTLRGLTGVGRATEVMTREEFERTARR